MTLSSQSSVPQQQGRWSGFGDRTARSDRVEAHRTLRRSRHDFLVVCTGAQVEHEMQPRRYAPQVKPGQVSLERGHQDVPAPHESGHGPGRTPPCRALRYFRRPTVMSLADARLPLRMTRSGSARLPE